MRRLRNLVITALIRRDLGGQADLDEVVTTMTAFGDFAVQRLLAAISADMIAQHGTPIGEASGEVQELIVLGMGKLGGGELNVSSDIDLIFVYHEDGETRTTSPEQRQLSNHEFFVRTGKKLIAALAEITEDGFTFRVDMALRPNGNSGPLAASFGMVEEYLIVQGREWERYAWVKARALTGKLADIAVLDKIIRPFVYRRYLDYGSIDAIRNMHVQIRAEVTRQETRHPERSHNVKLGRGGIREIEFLAQVFQLIRGGRDASLLHRSTRKTLRALAERRLLKPEKVEKLLHAYTFLRNLEHRLQYLDDAQTHTLPANDADRLAVARMMGYDDTAVLLAALEEQCNLVAHYFDEIFSDRKGDPKEKETKVEAELHMVRSSTDSKKSIAHYLGNLGFDEPVEAARRMVSTWLSQRLQTLPEASRNKLVALVNASLPIIAKVADRHAVTLGRLLDFLEAIARRAAYLALLTEYPHALERVIRMIAASNWAAMYLTCHPLLLDELLDDRTLKAVPDWPLFGREVRQRLEETPGDTERQMDVLREMHHAQLIRLLAQDLVGDLSVEKLADHLSALADMLVAETIHAIWMTLPNRHRNEPRFAVIAYGKLGGKELGYASDLDVIFLYDDDHPDAPALYAKLAQRFITWMTAHTPAGILFDIDIALRPDGASGLLVSTVASFEKYQTTSAWLWEHQALTRARYCAGDACIGSRFETIRENVLCQPREPDALKRQVLTMRTKLREAHPNKSANFDLKHDAGGMMDIEFIVQYMVLRHAAQYPQLTGDIGNIALLKLFGKLELINTELGVKAGDTYRIFRKLQHQNRLQGIEQVRVEKKCVEKEIDAVLALWKITFGD